MSPGSERVQDGRNARNTERTDSVECVDGASSAYSGTLNEFGAEHPEAFASGA